MLLPKTFYSERLTFEQLAIADAPELFAYTSQPDVSRYMVFLNTTSIDETLSFISHIAKQTELEREYCYVARQKTGGPILGHFGARFETAYKVEMGYIFNPNYWGKGYATESGRAICAELFKLPEVRRIQAGVHPSNDKSQNVLRKIGFRLEGNLRNSSIYPNVSAEPTDSLVFSLIPS